jgi:RNA polymerase sigma factor (sigma-70 family)
MEYIEPGGKSYKRPQPTLYDEPLHQANPASFSGKDDHEIWTAFKKGNRLAFIHIYNTYFDELYSYARQFTNDIELIKDAIQDVFVRLSESRERLSDTTCIKFYLFKSIKREVIFSSKKKLNFEKRLATINGLAFEYEASFEESLINMQSSVEILQKIRDAANNLNGRQREIIFYHFYEGFSMKQIKELMNLGSDQATCNLLSRALNQLRAVLGAETFMWSLILLHFLT